MKEKLLSYLVCPSCEGLLDLSINKTEDAEIMEGALRCASCASSFPITGGIPRFANLETVESDKKATAEGFGWQWQHFTQEDEKYAEQMLGWLAPVTPEFFRDKVVLEGGCGKGRHTQLAARWGAREIIGIDLSAQRNCILQMRKGGVPAQSIAAGRGVIIDVDDCACALRHCRCGDPERAATTNCQRKGLHVFGHGRNSRDADVIWNRRSVEQEPLEFCFYANNNARRRKRLCVTKSVV